MNRTQRLQQQEMAPSQQESPLQAQSPAPSQSQSRPRPRLEVPEAQQTRAQQRQPPMCKINKAINHGTMNPIPLPVVNVVPIAAAGGGLDDSTAPITATATVGTTTNSILFSYQHYSLLISVTLTTTTTRKRARLSADGNVIQDDTSSIASTSTTATIEKKMVRFAEEGPEMIPIPTRRDMSFGQVRELFYCNADYERIRDNAEQEAIGQKRRRIRREQLQQRRNERRQRRRQQQQLRQRQEKPSTTTTTTTTPLTKTTTNPRKDTMDFSFDLLVQNIFGNGCDGRDDIIGLEENYTTDGQVAVRRVWKNSVRVVLNEQFHSNGTQLSIAEAYRQQAQHAVDEARKRGQQQERQVYGCRTNVIVQ